MNKLNNKIDFAAIITVKKANPNGDPLNGNRPRTTYDGSGEISDVCIKRKIRNRMQDMGENIFVKSNERCDDEFKSLSERASKTITGYSSNDEYAERACMEWFDVRAFGQVFAFKPKSDAKSKEKKAKGEEKSEEKGNGVSVGVRGPVSIHQALSVEPVDISTLQITKSVNSEPTETGKKSSDTMGTKHMVDFGVYLIKGAINVQLAEKTGFSEEDAEKIKECLRTLFENDASAARPDGSMEVHKVYWWKHNNKTGQYSSAKVHKTLTIKSKEDVLLPNSIADYTIVLENLPGLEPEIIDGI